MTCSGNTFFTTAKLLTCCEGCGAIFYFFPRNTGQSHQGTAHHIVTLGLYGLRWTEWSLVEFLGVGFRPATAIASIYCSWSMNMCFIWKNNIFLGKHVLTELSMACVIPFTQFLYQFNVDAARFLNWISLTFSGQVRTCILPLKSMSSFCRTLYNDSVLSRANFFLVLLVF